MNSGSVGGAYTNYAIDFDGNNDYIKINNSGDINTGNNHTQKTIEAWFKVDNKNITSRKQTIYEQGGTVRGLNIYVFDGKLYVGDGMNQVERVIGTVPGYLPTPYRVINGTMLRLH